MYRTAKYLMASLSAAILASACGPGTEPASEIAAAPEAAGDAEQAAAPAPCAGALLPVTGLCAGDNLYAKINANHELPAPHCVWRPQEVSVSADEALVFRSLDCTQGTGQPVTYSYSGSVLTATWPPFEAGEPPYDMQALEIFPLNGETAEAVALKTLDTAPENQRERCVIRPLESEVALGAAFALSPNDELRAELESAAEEGMYDACGLYGATDSATWWEGRPGKALFHSTGQDTPPWDTASFTFYARSADGAWTKAD
jgi:hypothetical protein